MNKYDEAIGAFAGQFGQDTFLTLTTTDGERMYTRIVNSFYQDGAFYTVTSAASNKMKQIGKTGHVAISCGQPFVSYMSAHGVGENLGHVLAAENAPMMETLRKAFDKWYTHGDVNENDPNTCLLRIRLTDAYYMAGMEGYKINFVERSAS
jgi:general stress protein 26